LSQKGRVGHGTPQIEKEKEKRKQGDENRAKIGAIWVVKEGQTGKNYAEGKSVLKQTEEDKIGEG